MRGRSSELSRNPGRPDQAQGGSTGDRGWEEGEEGEGWKGRGWGHRRGAFPADQGVAGLTEPALRPMSHCGAPAPLAPGHRSPRLCRYSWLQAVPLGVWVGGGLPPWGAPGSTQTLLQAWHDSPETSAGVQQAAQRPAAGLNVQTKVRSAMLSPAEQNRGLQGPRRLREKGQPGLESFWWCPGRAGTVGQSPGAGHQVPVGPESAGAWLTSSTLHSGPVPQLDRSPVHMPRV